MSFQRSTRRPGWLGVTRPDQADGAFLVLSVLGLAARLVHLGDPPLDSAVGRQFHSAFLARVFYLEMSPELPEWRVAIARQEAPLPIEPPILEFASAIVFRLLDAEPLWIPRLISLAAWLVGAGFLYLIARQLGYRAGAIAAVATYLFLPFAIQYSRNFQPEPLMTALMLGAIWALLRHHAAPSWRSLFLAAALAAASLFVKPLSLFVIVAVFVALSIRRRGFWATAFSPQSWVFVLVATLPALAWGIYGFWVEGFLARQVGGRVNPGLLLTAVFWGRLIRSEWIVMTPFVLVIAVFGALLTPRGLPRTVLFAWAIGFAGLAFVLSHHVATHRYYSLQAIPLVALAAAPVMERLFNDRILRWPSAVLLTAGIVLGASAGISATGLDRAQWMRLETAPEIGRIVDHTDDTVVVVGRPGPRWLYFYGEFAGRSWLVGEWLEGLGREPPNLTADQAVERVLSLGKRYLVVADLRILDRIPNLDATLRSRLRIVADTPRFVIFDLRDPGP